VLVVEFDYRREDQSARDALAQAVRWVNDHPTGGDRTVQVRAVLQLINPTASRVVTDHYAGREATFRSQVRDLFEGGRLSTIQATVVPGALVPVGDSGTVYSFNGVSVGTLTGQLAPRA
jgi:hypothetical protein